MSHALVRACVVAVFLLPESGSLFACARSEEVDSVTHADGPYIVEDDPSPYALLWSYFGSYVASEGADTAREHE